MVKVLFFLKADSQNSLKDAKFYLSTTASICRSLFKAPKQFSISLYTEISFLMLFLSMIFSVSLVKLRKKRIAILKIKNGLFILFFIRKQLSWSLKTYYYLLEDRNLEFQNGL